MRYPRPSTDSSSKDNALTLEHWNLLPATEASDLILPCNGSRAWAQAIASLRPFDTLFDLTCTADNIWRALPPADWQQAFDSHPRIGEKRAKEASQQSLEWSKAEQSTSLMTADTQTQLAQANQKYESIFGRIFIVQATGKSAEEMLAILERRLANKPEDELREAAEQQRQITQLRLRKWFNAS